MKRTHKILTFTVALACGLLVLAACNGNNANNSAAQNGVVSNTDVAQQQLDLQGTTGAYTKQLTTAEPYPVAAMQDSAERANLRARLIRLNDPNRIGYVYALSSTGQVMAFWTIRGKVSSTGSQLSNTQNVLGYGGSWGAPVVDSMGDDGSYGPEECQSQGIFFFTADTDSLVEWCGPWMYSDSPLKLTTAPIITVSGSAPTSPVPQGGSTKK